MTPAGTLSNFRPPRAATSRARGWSQRTTPVVRVPAPSKDTAKPAVRAKLPPVVMGKTTGVPVRRLNAPGEMMSTGRVHCCSWPAVVVWHPRRASPLPARLRARPFPFPAPFDDNGSMAV